MTEQLLVKNHLYGWDGVAWEGGALTCVFCDRYKILYSTQKVKGLKRLTETAIRVKRGQYLNLREKFSLFFV